MQHVFSILGKLTQQKFKIFLVLVFAAIFFIVLFPFNDLSDLLTAKVSDASGGTVYLQFDKMGVDIIPFGLELDNLSVENSQLPALTAQSLIISPWIIGALGFKAGATVDATDLFKGNVQLTVHEGSKVTGDGKIANIEFSAAELSLPSVSEYLRLGNILALVIQGTLTTSTNLVVDPSFKDQPSGTIDANAAHFLLPSQSVVTPIGPMQTPPLNLGTLNFKGKMANGRLEIEELTFGAKNLDLSGKIKGELGLNFQPDGRGGVRPVMNTFDLKIDMTASKQFMDPVANPASGLVGGFLGQFRTDSAQGSRFAFRMKQPKFPGTPPELLPFQ